MRGCPCSKILQQRRPCGWPCRKPAGFPPCQLANSSTGRLGRQAISKNLPTGHCGGGNDTTIVVNLTPPLWSTLHHHCGHPSTTIVVTLPPQLWSPPHHNCGRHITSIAANPSPQWWPPHPPWRGKEYIQCKASCHPCAGLPRLPHQGMTNIFRKGLAFSMQNIYFCCQVIL